MMPGVKRGVSVAVAVCGLSGAWAQDCSEWRGPGRNGVLTGCPPLLDGIPEGGLKELWKVELPGGNEGNWSSPVGADGRVYTHVSWLKKEPIAERRLDKGVAGKLGAFDKNVPAELAAKIEAARVSGERQSQDKTALDAWVKKWIETHLDEAQRAKHARFAEDRLKRGPAAMSLPALGKLHELGGRTFQNQAELDQWLAAAGMTDAEKSEVNRQVPRERSFRDDTLVCVDAANGAVLWKKEFPGGGGGGRPASNTPCVSGGKVYFTGNSGAIHCLDAATGDEVWKLADAGKEAPNASLTVVDGRLIVAGGKGLTALDAATGKEFWRNEKVRAEDNSPSVWRHGGKTYVIAAGGSVACVSLENGAVLWTVPGGKWTTPAVAGDTLAMTISENSMKVYRLTPEKAEPVAEHPLKSRSCSPITDGKFVYGMARGDGVCIDATTGAQVWKGQGNNDTYSSPLMADGKILCNHRRGFIMYDAATGKLLGQAPISFGECMSAGLVDGKLLARDGVRLACYDLRKAAP